ncbi:MAG: hypothetical protein ACD_20C00051G0019 [uncultured bacterium]|nr:MAG: hypothetical protein ACD_20C00051G0019 [uncultured bacterium]HBH18166.1 methionyl-tRNA formyltransferase [Cyanobacteria bacterium UBA9579]
MKIVYLGTPEIAVPSLEYFIKRDDVEVLAVITQPDRPAGRGHKVIPPPVKIMAETNAIPVFQPRLIRKDEELINRLRQLKPDAFIMVAFGQILSKELLDIPRLGTINLHSSLLPKYRGANPIQWAIINGDKVTGITTMMSDVGVDTGPMLLKKEIEIPENMDACELSDIMAHIGPQMLYESMIRLDNGTVTPIPQNDAEATYASKLNKEDGKINWDESAEIIHNKVRGMKPWPATTTNFKECMIKIIETELEKDNKEKVNTENFGLIVGIIDSGIKVITGDGAIIIKKLQPAGKKVIDASCWYNGARVQKGDRFS